MPKELRLDLPTMPCDTGVKKATTSAVAEFEKLQHMPAVMPMK